MNSTKRPTDGQHAVLHILNEVANLQRLSSVVLRLSRFVGQQALERLQIDTGAEDAASCRENDRSEVFVLVQFGEAVADLLEHARVDRVQFLRSIQLDVDHMLDRFKRLEFLVMLVLFQGGVRATTRVGSSQVRKCAQWGGR